MNTQKRFGIRTMSMVGLLTALIFAANWIQFPIPTPIDSTRFHLGNVMCMLAGFVLGPVPGGLAAGFGGMFYDFTNPLYVNEAWITFIMKFAMAWLCGKIAWSGEAQGQRFRRNIVAAACGAALYVILYMSKNFIYNYYFLRMELPAVQLTVMQKGIVSTVNGIIAVIAAVPLNAALRSALDRAKLTRHPAERRQ